LEVCTKKGIEIEVYVAAAVSSEKALLIQGEIQRGSPLKSVRRSSASTVYPGIFDAPLEPLFGLKSFLRLSTICPFPTRNGPSKHNPLPPRIAHFWQFTSTRIIHACGDFATQKQKSVARERCRHAGAYSI
jgi:hypothetical protein